jgi:hypothetical protein
METNTTACKNCEEDYEVGFEFCPHCGQKTNDELTVGVLFYNTISNYFSFDARFFKSFIPLMFMPGLLAKRFIEGKRLLYLHPAQMYLFISVVFFFLFSIVSRDFVNKSDNEFEDGLKNKMIVDTTKTGALDSLKIADIKTTLENAKIVSGMNESDKKVLDSIFAYNAENAKNVPNLDLGFNIKVLDSLINIESPESDQLKAMGMKDNAGLFKRRFYTQGLKIYKQSGQGIVKSFIDSIPISMFVLLPIFAIILKLFFWRRGSFAHHLVFSFYFYSFLFTVFTIILLSDLIWKIPDWATWLVVLSTFFYLFLAIKHFYRQGYFVSFFKTCMVTFMYMIFVLPIAIAVMFAAAFMFY